MVKKPEKTIRKGLSVIFVEEELARVYIFVYDRQNFR